jgi:5'(3')-deoxyribonucleotidase
MQIFVDGDQVLADFDSYALKVLGMPSRLFEDQHGEAAFWSTLTDHPDFFYNLPLMPDAMDLWNGVKHLNPIILTGIPEGTWAVKQKVRWFAQHFQTRAVITCRSKHKSLYCLPGDIIIDDWPKHRALWEAQGGHWILHENAKKSLAELEQIMLSAESY